jgi:hypothetical protein
LSGFLGLGRPIPVRVPTAAFQFKGAAGHDLVGPLMAMGALDGFGSHFDQTFGHLALGALEFVDRHIRFLSPGKIRFFQTMKLTLSIDDVK